MDWLDIVIIVLLAVPAFLGLKAGIIKALFTVAGVVIGVILAGRFAGSLGGALHFISSAGTAKVVAFVFILLAVMIAATILALVITKLISAVLLGWLNRLGGAGLGVFLGFIFCGALLTMWVKYLGMSGAVSNSLLAGVLLNGFPIVLALLPSDFNSVRSFFK
jgi:membrane protein required for colicin V production